MEIKFSVDLKTVKKAFALMEIDIPADDELEKMFSNTVVDLSQTNDVDMKQAELGFVLMAVGQTLDKQTK